jgi:site-specific recombinase XerD
MPTIVSAIQQFRAYLQRRHYSPHTLDSYTLDLQVFFAASDQPLERISFREVDRFIDAQHQQGLSPATINRRLYTLKHFHIPSHFVVTP